jgi:hypothetical protein
MCEHLHSIFEKSMKKTLKPFPSKLEARAKELLINSQLTSKQIARDTGLSAAWLCDFSKNRLVHASAGRLEALYTYLSGNDINL